MSSHHRISHPGQEPQGVERTGGSRSATFKPRRSLLGPRTTQQRLDEARRRLRYWADLNEEVMASAVPFDEDVLLHKIEPEQDAAKIQQRKATSLDPEVFDKRTAEGGEASKIVDGFYGVVIAFREAIEQVRLLQVRARRCSSWSLIVPSRRWWIPVSLESPLHPIVCLDPTNALVNPSLPPAGNERVAYLDRQATWRVAQLQALDPQNPAQEHVVNPSLMAYMSTETDRVWQHASAEEIVRMVTRSEQMDESVEDVIMQVRRTKLHLYFYTC